MMSARCNKVFVVFFQSTDEYSVAVAVRVHRTLETAKDKFYMITCGKAGFQNTRYVHKQREKIVSFRCNLSNYGEPFGTLPNKREVLKWNEIYDAQVAVLEKI